jgi:hypothetical protein
VSFSQLYSANDELWLPKSNPIMLMLDKSVRNSLLKLVPTNDNSPPHYYHFLGGL